MQGLRLPGLIRGKPVKMRIGARNLASICANWADFPQIQAMSICHSAIARSAARSIIRLAAVTSASAR